MFARVAAAFALLALAAGTGAGGASRIPGAPLQEAAPGHRPGAPVSAEAPSGTRAPRIASYSIDARLEPDTRTISGSEVLTWRNTTAVPAATLQFHLYYNAWRNSNSTWMRERRLAATPALADVRDDDWGWIDVDTLHVTRDGGNGADLTSRLRFIAPDDGNADDRTVLEVPLDEPAEPGESVSVRIAWSSRVPRTFARTGAIGDYFFVAQWFPKIGVLEDTGWNCHQFHAATEFFADFGAYDVRLTVPSGWLVGATGTVQDTQEHDDGTTTHHYRAEDVHDFAWTTSPDYLELFQTFTHATLPSVEMRLLLQPEHRGQEARHFAAARAALTHYGEWFGPYPYSGLTIVDPAWQSRTGGMEYPTLFTAGTRWIAPRHASDPEDVIIHEAGHQFWYGIVATNEFEHAWLDEGLTTFSTSRIVALAFDPNHEVRRYFGGFIPWVFRDLPLSRETETSSLARLRAAGPADVPSTPTWRYWPGNHAATTYHKTALWLHTLERMLGWETLQRILSTYFTRWAFRHPKPEDFFAVANEVSGRDLTWFFDQVHRGAGIFDYGIERFSSERARTRGRADREEAAADAYVTTIVVRRFGEGVFPVDVKVLFENGEETRWTWDGRDRWTRFEMVKGSRASRVDVDPDRVLLLDVNTTNNSAAIDPASRNAAVKWSLTWLIWLQDHLLANGFFV